MEASALIKQEDGVESAKICRWCLTEEDALEALTPDESGQYKLQKLSEFTGVQVKLLPGVPLYLCTMCNSRLEKMDLSECNKNIASVSGFTENQNTAKNGADISKDQLGHPAEQTVGTELLIKTEVIVPDAATDLYLTHWNCTAPELNGPHECCGNQPFEAEENPITIKLEYVDVDELYQLQTNAILDHEQDDLQTNPLELGSQDREAHSMSNNMCADGTELTIKTEDTTPDAATDSHLNQKCCTVHEANRTYECCGKIPDDLFEAEENPIAIKSEYEEVDEQHQLRTTNDGLNHEKENPQSHRKKRRHHCPHCSSSFAQLSNLKIHIRTHTGERPYVCKVCDKAFKSRSNLAQHSKTHNKDQQQQCHYCSLMFAKSFNLKVHIRTHTGEKPYKCKVCGKAFTASKYLACHSKIHKKKEQLRWRCDEKNDMVVKFTNPQNTVKNESEIAQGHFSKSAEQTVGTELTVETEDTTPDAATDLHLKQKSCTVHQANKTYECCGKIPDDLFEAEKNPIAIKLENQDVDEQHQLQTTNDGLNHEQDNFKRQSKKRKYHCPHCSFSFAHLSTLKIHIATHTGEKPYQCKVCDKAFGSRGSLVQHSKIHNKDQHHQCPHCSSWFPRLASLKIHIRTHTGEKPNVCKVCEKAFRSPSNLLQHSKTHNKDQQHQCPYCPSMFAQSFNLNVHIRTHTGEKPYKCKVCDKAFRSPSKLTQHSKMHNKDQQHQCPYCPSMFAQSYNLKIHIRAHTDERPHKCKFCDKTFRQSGHLIKHSKIHKKGETH